MAGTGSVPWEKSMKRPQEKVFSALGKMAVILL